MLIFHETIIFHYLNAFLDNFRDTARQLIFWPFEPLFSTVLAITAEFGDIYALSTVQAFEDLSEELGSLCGTATVTEVLSESLSFLSGNPGIFLYPLGDLSLNESSDVVSTVESVQSLQ